MKREAAKVARFLIVAPVLWLVLLGGNEAGQLLRAAPGSNSIESSNPSNTVTTADSLFGKLVEFNRRREARLEQYSVRGTYRVENAKGEMTAESEVLLRYQAPGKKEFKILSEKGSRLIRSRVFKPLMEVEVDAAARNRDDSSITPNNYTFELLGEEDINGYHCFVVQAIPKRADKYLFNGKIWIHAQEYAVVQIEGKPAVSPSVWIKRVDFVRRYQKVGEFWLPINNQTNTLVRIFGRNTLITDYDNYQINRAGEPRP